VTARALTTQDPVRPHVTFRAHLRAAGTSILVVGCAAAPDQTENGTVPVLLHWGADLGSLTDSDVTDLVRVQAVRPPGSALDQLRWTGLLPQSSGGFTGTPALEGARPVAPAAWQPRWSGWELTQDEHEMSLTAADPDCGLAVRVELEITAEGLLRTRSTVTNTAETDFGLGALRSVLPVPHEATELLDLTGRWTRERVPQRHPFEQGTWQRSGRHGRTGHDATLLLVAGTPGFSFRRGTVWAVHLAWSGDHVHYAERTPEGDSLLGAHELLGPGEVVLGPGASYSTPWLTGSWSDAGLDGLSARLHTWQRRARPRPLPPRPVLVNTWEAVFFDHDLHRLTDLADAAHEVGVERFVLDDGWFRGRRDDTAGLGDWTVDRTVWPRGLHPLIEHVHGLGMDFGLWVEPEMVNEDSDLAREHPDWLLRGRRDLPPQWRGQQVLDLQHRDAFAHVRDALLALLEEYDVAFLKWDHNRDLVDAAHAGRPAVHGQTLAFYELLDVLRAAHPTVEIETCASGGGRVDLGVLSRTDRLWASDTIDALERQQIQRWTTLLVPPEMMGAHVGSPVAHTTGRTHRLGFRAATALLGHLGIEWDLTRVPADERAELAGWVALHKRLRPLIAEGILVRGDHPDPAVLVTGMVSPTGGDAVFVVATVATTATQAPAPVLLPGLRADRRYAIRRVGPGEEREGGQGWLSPGATLPGSVLGAVGVRLPAMLPETAVVLHCTAAGGQGPTELDR
jgi:alpha-galactosidase